MTRYAASIEHLSRAESVIPLGAQTFSKSRTQYGVGGAPLYAHRAHGSRIWDIDGNEYVDLVNGLGCIGLGYGEKGVNAEIRKQLTRGASMSLSTTLEAEVAERLVDLIPCAEMVRFAKNGTDVTSAAVRLARAFTGNDHVIVTGYHGWADWFIGTTSMDAGVPNAVRSLTHHVDYGDIDKLRAALVDLPRVAAVVVEPMTSQYPPAGYLEEVRRLTAERDIVLIFDEMLTGFRVAPGGAQELFGVTPDLACFGKALGNGLPIAALVGRADIMSRLSSSVFFSGTHGGEALSLAAANAVVRRTATGWPTRFMAEMGQALADQVGGVIAETGASDYLSLSGHSAWKFLQWRNLSHQESALRTLFLQQMAAHGVLILGTHTVSFALSDDDIAVVVDAYRHALVEVVDAIEKGNARERVQGDPITPLFTVRT